MEVNKRFFDDKLRDRRLSLRSVAKQMDMLPSQLSLTLNGKRRMQIAEAVKIGQILGAPLADVMIAAGIEEAKHDRRRCNIIGHLVGGGEVSMTKIDPVGKGAIERVIIPDGLPDNVEAIQARTHGSNFAHADGWLFFLSAERQSPNELIGQFSAVQIENGPMVVGTIGRGYTSGTYNVMAWPLNLESQRIEYAKRIIAIFT